MSKQSSVIEINGKRYDAITGKLIGTVKKIVQPAASGSIDGFTRTKDMVVRTVKPHPKHPAHEVHKRAQKSKTLMRGGVKRPKDLKGFNKVIKNSGLGSINPGRLSRASSVHKSHIITRYAKPVHGETKKAQNALVPASVSTASAGQSEAALTLAKPVPSLITSVSHQKLERLLDEALAKADAHKQSLKLLQKRSFWSRASFAPKWLSVIAVAVLLIGAISVYVYQKVPQVSMKLASDKAKISASLPTYTPEGFNVSGPVKYQSGAVVMNYGAGASQNYTLSQKASDWDSVSLAANAIPSSVPVQSSQVKGTTVYIYGTDNDATWVSNGIRYSLKDNANLSSDQILKIANSL